MLKKIQNEPLRLHQALARRRFWQRQLLRCSTAALVASLVAWLSGVPLPWHLALVAAGFIAGFLRPWRGAMDWALRWIETQTGLSYRTALEFSDNEKDAYGFREAIGARISEQLRRLELPSLQPWWLPVLTLALGLTLLPVLNRVGSPLDGGMTVEGGSSPLMADPTPISQTPEISRGANGENEQEAQTPSGPEAESENDLGASSQLFDSAGGPADNAAGAPPTDSETLSRFLQNLEQRPPEPEQNDQNLGDESPGGGRQGQGPERRSEGTGELGQSAGNEQGNPQSPGNAQSEGGSEAQRARSSGDETSSEGGNQTGGAAPRAEQNSGQPQSPPAGEPQSGEQAGQSQAGQSQAETQGQAGGSPTEGQGGNPNAEEALQRGAGEGAGMQGAEAAPADPSELEADPQGAPEGLEGRFLGGPTNIGGEVLLPGRDDGTAPSGLAPQSFERALEEAITEGRIPVEYQEILREYYR